MNKYLFLLAILSLFTLAGYADNGRVPEEESRLLTKEELASKIGRYDDVEDIPEDFAFNPAEEKLWLSDHFASVTEPISMYYEFERTGSYDLGFVDSIYLKVIKLNEDGTKNTRLDFLTGEKKQSVRPDNINNIRGNPVLGIFLQGDVKNMQQLTGGNYRHFIKMIKIALRETARVAEISFTFNGKEYKGNKISFQPYLNDTHRSEYERFAMKTYEFTLSDDIPGSLYQIKTVIPNINKPDAKKPPLIQETITLKSVKTYEP